MKKILFALVIMAILACPAMAQRYRQHQVTIVDEFGDAVTNIDIIEIQDAGTSTTSTIYTNRAGDVNMMNPMTTTSTNSSFVQSLGLISWFQAAPTYKIVVTESGASQSLTIDNQTEGDTRFPFYVNYIGAAATLQVTDTANLDIGTGDDFIHDWDNSAGLYVIFPGPASSPTDGGKLHFGKAASHTDIYFHAGDITTDYIFFDEGSLQMSFVDIDLLIDDEAKLLIGDSGDVTIEYDENNEDLDILSTSALDEIAFGATGDGYDLKWWSTTSGDYVLFDYSHDILLLEDITLSLGDSEKILLGGTVGTGSMFISVTSDVMEIGQVAALTGSLTFGNDDDGVDVTFYGDSASQKAWWDASGDEWFFGANAEGVDVTWYGDIASSYMKWDETAETHGALIFEAADLHMMDADYVIFGDGSDFKVHSTTGKTLTITPAGADELYSVTIGSDQSGVDLALFGATASDILLWDASDDYLHMIGDKVLFTLAEASAANVFKVDCTGASGDTNVIVLETTDGGIQLLADGDTEGDIDIDAEDDITITAAGALTTTVTGDYTLAVTGATVLPNDVLLKTTTALTHDHMDNLAGTPKELVAAVAGNTIEFVSAIFALDWGTTAWTEASAPDDLVIRYTDGSGYVVSAELDAGGFATATEDTVAFLAPSTASDRGAVTEAASTNQGLFLDNTGDEWTNSGDSQVVVIVYYRLHTTAELGL